jgi:hypothetical protein
MHGKKNAYMVLVKKPVGKKALGKQSYRCEIITKWILQKQDWAVWIGLIRLGIWNSSTLM